MKQVLLSVAHVTQIKKGECLVAASAIVLNYLGTPYSYRRLSRTLKIIPEAGVASFHVRRLRQLGVSVRYQQGTLTDLCDQLQNNQPCIVFLKTTDLPYWDEETAHAVVIVGMSEDLVYLNDPAFAEAPISVPIGDFDLAWLEHDEMYAVIALE